MNLQPTKRLQRNRELQRRRRQKLKTLFPPDLTAELEPIAVRTRLETARILGMTHQGVRFVERSGLAKIRRAIAPFWKEYATS